MVRNPQGRQSRVGRRGAGPGGGKSGETVIRTSGAQSPSRASTPVVEIERWPGVQGRELALTPAA